MIDRDKYIKAEKSDVVSRSELLNFPGHHSTASVTTMFNPNDGWSCTVTISDCDRKITLTTDCDREREWANSMFKIDTLIDVLKDHQKNVRAHGRKKGWKL